MNLCQLRYDMNLCHFKSDMNLCQSALVCSKKSVGGLGSVAIMGYSGQVTGMT